MLTLKSLLELCEKYRASQVKEPVLSKSERCGPVLFHGHIALLFFPSVVLFSPQTIIAINIKNI